MNYEIVTLEEKMVVGLIARTNNQSPDMGAVIGGLWERFYGQGIYEAIRNKSDGKALGIYMDYAGDEKDDYSIMVACEVNGSEVPERKSDIQVRTIPGGRYAKFVVTGDMHQAVAEFWQELWKMDLERTFVCDFEEYQNEDMENATIHIYIGVK